MDTRFSTITVGECEHIVDSGIPIAVIRNTSKEFVDWALEHNTNNRNKKKGVISTYARDMVEYNWRLTNQGIGFATNGVLIDGQHRLLANQRAGYPEVPMLIVFGLEKEAQIDVDAGTIRTTANMLKISRNCCESNVKAAILIWLLRIEKNVETRATTQNERLDAYDRYCNSLDEIYKTPLEPGFPAPFFAPLVFLHYRGVRLDQLISFRDGCFSGENLGKGDPRLTWRRKCLSFYRARGCISQTVLNHTMVAIDKFLRGRTLTSLPTTLSTIDEVRTSIEKLNKLAREFGYVQ